MQGKHLYEYAVIRLVPKVEREEFFNVGIILFSKRAKYIKALYKVDENKLNLFSSELDRESLFANLHVFDNFFSGTNEGGPIAALDPGLFAGSYRSHHIWQLYIFQRLTITLHLCYFHIRTHLCNFCFMTNDKLHCKLKKIFAME